MSARNGSPSLQVTRIADETIALPIARSCVIGELVLDGCRARNDGEPLEFNHGAADARSGLDRNRELGGCRRIRRLGHDFSDGITDRRRSRLAVQRQARAELADSRRKKRLIRRRIWQSDDGHPMGE
jgi:hypothetical protein